MSRRRNHLDERREHLIEKVAAQRRVLARRIEPWRTPFAMADQGLAMLRYIKGHPQWIFGVIALLAVTRPRRIGKWLGRGWISWQMMHGLRGKLR